MVILLLPPTARVGIRRRTSSFIAHLQAQYPFVLVMQRSISMSLMSSINLAFAGSLLVTISSPRVIASMNGPNRSRAVAPLFHQRDVRTASKIRSCPVSLVWCELFILVDRSCALGSSHSGTCRASGPPHSSSNATSTAVSALSSYTMFPFYLVHPMQVHLYSRPISRLIV